MNSNDIHALIERIASTSSKNDKVAALAEHRDDAELRRVLTYALLPGRTYGMAARPDASGADASAIDLDAPRCAFDAQTWDILDALAERKLTGHAARNSVALEMQRLSEESAELLWRIIVTDLRAGFSSSTVNKAIPGLIPDPAYMRCSLPKSSNLAKFPWERGVFSQKKANGMFANLDVFADESVSLHLREGNKLPMEAFDDLAQTAQMLLEPGFQHHGELLVVENGRILPRQIGNGILTSVAKGGSFGPGQSPLYEVWDRIPLSAAKPKGRHAETYKERMAALRALFESGTAHMRLIDTRIVYSMQEAIEHCVQVMAEGEEGTIVKSPDLRWLDGTSKDAVKLKVEACCDLRVKGILTGRPGTKVEGRPTALNMETACAKLRVDVTVKNEKLRAAIEANPGDYMERIFPVLFNEITCPSASNDLHSLYLPRLAEDTYRIDKNEPDDLARVFEQFEEAKSMKALMAA